MNRTLLEIPGACIVLTAFGNRRYIPTRCIPEISEIPQTSEVCWSVTCHAPDTEFLLLLPDSHMNFNRTPAGVVLLFFLPMIVGCPAPPKMTDVNGASRTEPAEPQQPVIFTDRDSLQSGTGIVDDDAPTDFQETASGLKYRVLRKSEGIKPEARNTVTVNYRGWLDSGREFDSSYKRAKPIDFGLSEVVRGWGEGLQYCPEGGMIELEVPSRRVCFDFQVLRVDFSIHRNDVDRRVDGEEVIEFVDGPHFARQAAHKKLL